MKKVLFVSGQEMILNQNNGGKQCGYRNYCMLKEVYGETNVYAYIFTNENSESSEYICREKSHNSSLGKVKDVLLLRSFCSIQQEKKLFKYIQNNRFDLVFFERAMFGPLIKKLSKAGIYTQVFAENLEKNYVWNKVKNQSIFFLMPYLSTKFNEKISFQYVNSYIALTARDKVLIEKIYGKECDAIIPMTFKDKFLPDRIVEMEHGKKTLLFIGSNFLPNYDGIKWFVENIMSELAEYDLIIVGKDFEKNRKELQRENVKVVGTVDDLEPYYYSNSAMIMPILYGDGIKVKTAEAMMFGKTMFASREALIGYEVDNIEGIYECNSAEEYIENIRRIYNKVSNWGYSENVRQKFLNTYENSSAVKEYKRIFFS